MTDCIAFFITPHGFGHAARACAVMAALKERHATIRFEIFTTVPEWFFENSIGGGFNYHCLETDVGLLQTSPFHADLGLTLKRLRDFVPFGKQRLQWPTEIASRSDCRLVVSDIAPLGIAVAGVAGIPSLLIENFTWDWIYDGCAATCPEMKRYAGVMREYFQAATYHIQTEPVCEYRSANLLTAPAARKTRLPKKNVRERLKLPENASVVLMAFGGVRHQNSMLSGLEKRKDIHFIVPCAVEGIRQKGNATLIPHDASLFHPDLIQASDAVVGKAGYSTIAEVYQAGVPFGYVSRSDFRESPILKKFIQTHMQGISIDEEKLYDGSWQNHLDALLRMTPAMPPQINGADQIADFILDLMSERRSWLSCNRLRQV